MLPQASVIISIFDNQISEMSIYSFISYHYTMSLLRQNYVR